MRLMLDTNVVLDVLMNREPFFVDSYLVFRNIAENADDALFLASATTDVYYYIRTMEKPKEAIWNLRDVMTFTDVLEEDCIAALNSPMQDYEDALISAVAYRRGAECIVSRNTKDFALSKVPAVTPKEWLDERGLSM